jgi:1-acyl-sn-glycerol-3-phosphate acyltransferase
MLGAIRGRVVREGTPPPQAAVFVCNHLSYVDLLVFLSEWPCVFVAKVEVTRIPVLGGVAADIGTIFINRQDFTDVARVNTRIEQTLQQGQSVVIFPEATTTEGASLLPFHASLFESAARSGQPVWYGALHYSAPPGARPASESVAWGDKDIGMREHMQGLLSLPGFTARIRYGRRPIGGSNRKVLAQALRAAVTELFEPVGQ